MVIVLLLLAGAVHAQSDGSRPKTVADGIQFIGMFKSDSDVMGDRTPCQRMRDFFDRSGAAHDVTGERPAVCDKIVDIVAGKAEARADDSTRGIRGSKIATDTRGRILVSEPRTNSVHLLDFEHRKAARIQGNTDEHIASPYAVAADAEDNLYVTDVKLGRIAIFDRGGKFKKYIGDYKGERAFEDPKSIAIDRASGRIFLADVSRQYVLIFDREGKRLASIGKRGGGTGAGEFRLPTDVALHNKELFVLDKRNMRIQVFDFAGHYKRQIRTDALGAQAPQGIAVDARGRIFVAMDIGIEVLSATGERLFRFGGYGTGPGEFKDLSGIYIDAADRLYVSDTGNERVQVFQIVNEQEKVRAER